MRTPRLTVRLGRLLTPVWRRVPLCRCLSWRIRRVPGGVHPRAVDAGRAQQVSQLCQCMQTPSRASAPPCLSRSKVRTATLVAPLTLARTCAAAAQGVHRGPLSWRRTASSRAATLMPYSQGQYLAYMSLLGGMGAESKRERPYDHPERSSVAAPVAALSQCSCLSCCQVGCRRGH